jgi:hypothetical protein
MVDGEFGGWKEVRPAVRREGDVAGREDSNKVILSRPDRVFGTIGAVVLGRGILELDGGLGLKKEGFEVKGGLIVQLKMREGVRERREKGADRWKSTDVGCRGSRHTRNEMDIVTVKNKKNVLITAMRGDGETTGEIGCSPLTARDGARASRGGRKSGGRRRKARANTTRTRRRDHRAQTRLRDFLPRGRDTFTEGIKMSE